jgi:hypothetical protein
MSLPQIEHKTFAIELPISKKKFRFRPYLKKEDRILMQAMEEEDIDEIYEATKQVILNCITEGKTDVDSLPVIDVQYFFLQLRKRSVGPQIRLSFTCNNVIAGTPCNYSTPIGIEIDDIALTEIPDKNFNIIALTDKIGVVMRYPTYAIDKKIAKFSTSEDKVSRAKLKNELIASLIEKVYDEKDVFESFNEEEIKDFMDNLNFEQAAKIDKFIETIPNFVKIHNFVCKKCGYAEDIKIEGFESFFG